MPGRAMGRRGGEADEERHDTTQASVWDSLCLVMYYNTLRHRRARPSAFLGNGDRERGSGLWEGSGIVAFTGRGLIQGTA
ncbi:hypothetical protein VTI74DRAFT_6563 [Chaetomium olivicolor]